ncbi:hypothetical protein TNCV_3555731 [Trichonephila clavipes]|nr:hypothetical protein TNCV_3555731 [Trichonephila clavipes]
MVTEEQRYGCMEKISQVDACRMFLRLHRQLCENDSFIASTDGRGRSRTVQQTHLRLCGRNTRYNNTRAFGDGPPALNRGQVTWTTPELASPSPNYPTTPTGGRLSFRQI